MTTAIERLIRECPEGEWLPSGYFIEGGQIYAGDPSPDMERVPVAVTKGLEERVQGRLAELLAGADVHIVKTNDEWAAMQYIGPYEVQPLEGCGTERMMIDAQADAWIAVGRG